MIIDYYYYYYFLVGTNLQVAFGIIKFVYRHKFVRVEPTGVRLRSNSFC